MVRDLMKVFTPEFINKLLASLHLKIYDYSATDKQIKRKEGFKNNFIHIYKHRLEETNLKRESENKGTKSSRRKSNGGTSSRR